MRPMYHFTIDYMCLIIDSATFGSRMILMCTYLNVFVKRKIQLIIKKKKKVILKSFEELRKKCFL